MIEKKRNWIRKINKTSAKLSYPIMSIKIRLLESVSIQEITNERS